VSMPKSKPSVPRRRPSARAGASLGPLIIVGITAFGIACGAGPATPRDRSACAPSAVAPLPTALVATVAPSAIAVGSSASESPGAAPPPAPPPVLPDGVRIGARTSVRVPEDRDVLVYSGPAEARRAFVYLHGICGNPLAPETWAHVVTTRGTLIVVRGESPCAERPGRFSWKAPVPAIAGRIDRALAAVRRYRGGLLDTDQVVLIGYSQGAARAEALAQAFPERFPLVVLASGPSAPDPEALAATSGIAVLCGSEEWSEPLETGVAALNAAGLRAHFFTLPGAHHGDYGYAGARVIDDALAWLLGEPR
jgi:predicted esterase